MITMRSKIYIISIIAALLCCFGNDAEACGVIECRAKDYLLYRVYDSSRPVLCRPVIEQLQESDDPEVMEYLKLARTCEAMRDKQNSRWYYPSKNDPVVSSLEDVLQRSLDYKGSKLKERYALQAARAMFALGRFEQMCNWWKEKDKEIAPGAIREHIIGYVAGAKYRTGETEMALQYYASIGDVASIEYCLRQEGRYNGYCSIAGYCAEYPSVLKSLQEEITNLEHYNDYFMDKGLYDRYYSHCMETAGKSLDPAPWLYTAAFLKYMQGQYYVAGNILSRAEKTCNTEFLANSIRVLRILIDASVSTYNKAYETKLLGDLKWLDEMICRNLTEEIKQETAENGYYLKYNLSFYYWNDMMRKIVLGTIVPRMVEAGKRPLAILLSNYAENRLISLVDRVHVYWWEYQDNLDEFRQDISLTLSEYRRRSDIFNIFDYSNDYFESLSDDNTPLACIHEYSMILSHPSTALQAFLVERSYVNDDYLNELIGTRYLRLRKYEKAYEYLSKVSKDYQKCLNTYIYMRRLPFHYNRNLSSRQMPDYKLDFAEQMLECEEIIAKSTDPDKVGHARIKYGIGLRNSMDYCWALTQYVWYGNDDHNNELVLLGDRQIRSGLNQQSNPNHCDVLANYY